MASRIRWDRSHTPPRHPWIGLSVSSQCRDLDGVLIELGDRVGELQPVILAADRLILGDEIPGLFAQLANSPTCPLASITAIREQLSQAEAALTARLLEKARLPSHRIRALGVQDPGLWSFPQQPGAGIGYLGLCDAARLAELCEIDVIDAFPARDLAQGGQGGPLSALAHWMLLHDSRETRVLLDLGQTARISYLPAARLSNAMARVLSFDVGPGTRILDVLAQRLTSGQHHFDPGGRLAVQGRRISELLEVWLKDPYFDRPLPRWQPRGVRPERFLGKAMPMAVEAGWSVRDLLCTATHFVAEAVWMAISRRLPDDPPIGQLVVTGGGQSNGMLLREIQRLTPDVPMAPIDTVFSPGEFLDAACSALLAWMHLCRMPASAPAISGTNAKGVLGRLTPGLHEDHSVNSPADALGQRTAAADRA